MKQLSRLDQIAFSDLVERAHDVQFSDQFSEKGSFAKLKRHNREYWYHRTLENDADGNPKIKSLYVGPVDDVEITKRVENASRLKADYIARRKLASQLRRSGLPSPSRIEGEVISQLAKEGLFRLRALLVGSHAFQCFSGLLGVKLDEALYRTEDIDIAQYHSISVLLDDAMSDVGTILKNVDASFRPIFDPESPLLVAGYKNVEGVKVEFLTPNRGNAIHNNSLAKMPALGGIGAQPLPYLDFLIRDPVRSVLLHDAGVGVIVPTPERYAIHKLIVSTRRRKTDGAIGKSSKDMAQASTLIKALTATQQDFELGSAWMEAWERGPRWRRRLSVASLRLSDQDFSLLEDAVITSERLASNGEKRHGLGSGKQGILKLRNG